MLGVNQTHAVVDYGATVPGYIAFLHSAMTNARVGDTVVGVLVGTTVHESVKELHLRDPNRTVSNARLGLVAGPMDSAALVRAAMRGSSP